MSQIRAVFPQLRTHQPPAASSVPSALLLTLISTALAQTTSSQLTMSFVRSLARTAAQSTRQQTAAFSTSASARDVARIQLVGRLVADPEVKATRSGKDYVSYTVATTDPVGPPAEDGSECPGVKMRSTACLPFVRSTYLYLCSNPQLALSLPRLTTASLLSERTLSNV